MSVFKYNTIQLPYTYSPSGTIRAVREVEGDTDWCLMEYDLSIQSVISPAYVSILGASLGLSSSDSPAAIMQAVQAKLLQHRKALSYSFGSVNFIPPIQQGIGGTVDAQNGPKPVGCTVTDLTNNSFLISFRIQGRYWNNLQVTAGGGHPLLPATLTNQQGNNFIYNRWSETVRLDEKQYTSRYRSGVARIRSDNKDGITPDEARSVMMVIGVPMGFVRKHSQYMIQPDGLAVKYEMQDQEVFLQPPEPAFTASGKYLESGADGTPTRYGRVDVHLTGRKDTIRGDLIETAVGVAASTLLINGAQRNTDGAFTKLSNVSVSVPLWANEVEVHMTAIMNPRTTPGGKGRFAGATGVNWNKFTQAPVGSEPGTLPPDYTDRGTAGLILQAAAYYDPSLTATVMNKITGQLSRGSQPGRTGKTPEN